MGINLFLYSLIRYGKAPIRSNLSSTSAHLVPSSCLPPVILLPSIFYNMTSVTHSTPSAISLRIACPLVLTSLWRTSILQTPERLIDALTQAFPSYPSLGDTEKKLLVDTARWCDDWTDTLPRNNMSKLTAGLIDKFEGTRPQEVEQGYYLMRLTVLDHLVWVLLPESFPLSPNAISEVATVDSSRQVQIAGWEKAIKTVIKNSLTEPEDTASLEPTGDNLSFDERIEILLNRYGKIRKKANVYRAQTNISALAVGLMLYAVGIIHNLYFTHAMH
jgi:hypothetical protein